MNRWMTRRGFVFFCIAAEIGVIAVTIIHLYRVRFRPHVLGAATVSPLRREYLIFPINSPLRYYYEPKPNITEEEQPDWLDHPVAYTINSDTFNERRDYAVVKPKDTYRIIALGDSFTFGHYVNTAENWTEKLEDMLNISQPCHDGRKYEVINLGERGYDVQYIAYRYKSRGKKYNPDFIIWHESGSGFDRIKELLDPMVEQATKELTDEEKALIRERPNTDPALYTAVRRMKQRYDEEFLFEQVYASWLDFFETRGDVPVLITTFSYLPSRNMAKLKYWTSNREHTWIYGGIPNIYELGGGLPDGHPNAHGHEIIATYTYQYLVGLQSVLCKK